MNALISALVHRPRPVILVLVVLLIAGGSTYVTIPKEAEPDIPIPQIYINIAHEGISPEDAERLLIRPMEQELRTIEGLKELRATAAEGIGVHDPNLFPRSTALLKLHPGFGLGPIFHSASGGRVDDPPP